MGSKHSPVRGPQRLRNNGSYKKKGEKSQPMLLIASEGEAGWKDGGQDTVRQLLAARRGNVRET